MIYIDNIGIEKEFWLLNDVGQIQEPAIFGFPNDEYGFLVELRTNPCIDMSSLLADFDYHFRYLEVRAKMLALKLSDEPNMPRPVGLVEYLSPKYRYGSLQDLTANINAGTVSSHATGIFEDSLTAGIHVHFSRHDELGRRVQLPIFEIVKKMDLNFRGIIRGSNRILGEYELKSYGFEYRSLPANAPLEKVIEKAFKILESA